MPKLIYIANHHNVVLDDTEGHITYAFKKHGWEVEEIMETEYEKARNMEGDLLLFHHWDIPERLEFIKNHPTKKKAYWYFDKVWQHTPEREELTTREKLTQDNLSVVDYAFTGDGTYALQYPNSKFRILRQAIGDRLIDQGLGIQKGLCNAKIVFTGNIYGRREEWARQLKQRYGNDFQIVTGFYNRNLYDLFAEVPIVVAPPYYLDDHYWGNRVYLTTGGGGFLVHYLCANLTKEFTHKKHLVYYRDYQEMFDLIDYYLEHEDERKAIQSAGFERAKELTFTTRVGELLNYLK